MMETCTLIPSFSPREKEGAYVLALEGEGETFYQSIVDTVLGTGTHGSRPFIASFRLFLSQRGKHVLAKQAYRVDDLLLRDSSADVGLHDEPCQPQVVT